MKLSIETLTESAEFADLQARWDELLGASTQNNAFASWGWLYSWWEVFATSDFTLQIVLFQEGDTLVGLAPFQVHDTGLLTGKVLRFIGTGEPTEHEVVSEYLDVICRVGYESRVEHSLMTWLREHENEWRQMRFDDVLEDSVIYRCLSASDQHSRFLVESTGMQYSVALHAQDDAYRDRLTSSRRKRLRRCENALKKDSDDGNGLVRKSLTEPEQIESALETLKALNTERWSEKTGKGVFDSTLFMDFHRRVARRLLPDRRVALEIFNLNEKPLAALYLFYSQHACHYYQSGFASAGGNRYMPLFVAHVQQIEHSQQQGLHYYDFMRGGNSSYKSDYACDAVPMVRLRLFRSASGKQLHLNLMSARRLLVFAVRRLQSGIRSTSDRIRSSGIQQKLAVSPAER